MPVRLKMAFPLAASVSSLLLAVTLAASGHTPPAPCRSTDTTCEFWLTVEHHLTMMKGNVAVYPQAGQLYKYNDDTASTPVNVSEVISADGWENSRLVVAVNGSVPGPAIEVWEGQNLVIHVTNLMSSTSTTIHWHGLHQKGTPWMDGVAFVNQCPIEPLQTFTYRFKAYPSGTFWYHSHIGSQLSMGAVGALIIRRPAVDTPSMEHIMMLQEWNHRFDADVIHSKMVFGNYENRQKLSSSKSIEGTSFSMFPFDSGLINGRGRYFNNNGDHNQAPLTIYPVSQNETYRFRMIGSGSLYPFKVSIDDHRLTVVASDGYEIDPVTVDAVIINPGERYDFLIHANNTPGRYWVRGVTLEINVDNHVALAVLEYDEAAGSVHEADSSPRECTAQDRCVVLNCPFVYFPESYYSDCIPVGSLKSGEKHQVPGAQPGEEVTDIFLNFAFPGSGWTPGSVNGRAFRHPPSAALTQPQDIPMQCDPKQCGEDKVCACTYSVTLEHNKAYQVVMMNMGSGRGWAHPVHMHGHSYHVVKLGFPAYDSVTGQVGADSTDIDCGGQTNFCNEAKWANSSWGGNSVPGLELDLPPRKDTIMVPSGGYVVVRIKADNPGLWFMHCHVELHNSDGMALILNESFSQQPAPPAGFPRCGSFNYDEPDDTRQQSQPVEDDDDDDIKEETFWIVVGCLAGVILIQFLVIVCICMRRSGKSSSSQKQTQIPAQIPAHIPAMYSNEGFVAK